uniref:Uncharacterized protein n=1 Tax=Anguilla anguilla TaxID=7936 RepID=A0A0E9PW09_ANGAN
MDKRLDKLKCFEAISVQTKTVSEREQACVLMAAVCDGDGSGCLALEWWARASQRSLAAPKADLHTPGFLVSSSLVFVCWVSQKRQLSVTS